MPFLTREWFNPLLETGLRNELKMNGMGASKLLLERHEWVKYNTRVEGLIGAGIKRQFPVCSVLAVAYTPSLLVANRNLFVCQPRWSGWGLDNNTACHLTQPHRHIHHSYPPVSFSGSLIEAPILSPTMGPAALQEWGVELLPIAPYITSFPLSPHPYWAGGGVMAQCCIWLLGPIPQS